MKNNCPPVRNPQSYLVRLLVAGFFASAFAASPVQGAIITWGGAQNILADTDVSLNGTLVRAANLVPLNPQTAFGNNASFISPLLNISEIVNGVTFVAEPQPVAAPAMTFTLANGDVFVANDPTAVGPGTAANRFVGFGGPSDASGTPVNGPFNTLNSVPYQRMLSTSWWNDGTNTSPTLTSGYNITLNNLTVGLAYELQVWVNDSRLSNLGEANPNLFTSFSSVGGNTVDLQHNVNDALGGIGQYAIGTFTADGTSQLLSMLGGTTGPDVTGPNITSLIGAYQLRAVPEPSTIALAGLGAGLLALRRRMKR